MSGLIRRAASVVLAESAVAVSHTGNTTETTLATIAVPASAMGANGQVVIEALFTVTGSTNSKTVRLKFGGTAFVAAATSTASVVSTQVRTRIANRNATNSQIGSASPTVFGPVSNANVTSAIDTTAAVNITITAQLGLSSETITLESYQVILYPKA